MSKKESTLKRYYYITNAAGLYLTHGMKYTDNRALAWAFTDNAAATKMVELLPSASTVTSN